MHEEAVSQAWCCYCREMHHFQPIAQSVGLSCRGCWGLELCTGFTSCQGSQSGGCLWTATTRGEFRRRQDLFCTSVCQVEEEYRGWKQKCLIWANAGLAATHPKRGWKLSHRESMSFRMLREYFSANAKGRNHIPSSVSALRARCCTLLLWKVCVWGHGCSGSPCVCLGQLCWALGPASRVSLCSACTVLLCFPSACATSADPWGSELPQDRRKRILLIFLGLFL